MEGYYPKKVEKHKFSFTLIHSVFKRYELVEWATLHYCCYGEDTNCWVDVESDWLRGSRSSASYAENQRMYMYIKQYFNRVARNYNFNLFKRKMFVGEDEESLCICVPLRDKLKEDVYLTFNKKAKYD